MKKFLFLLLIIINICIPISAYAEGQITNIILAEAIKSGSKWNWKFNLTTKDIPNGTDMTILITQNNTTVKTEVKKINNNALNYSTGYILEDNKEYNVLFMPTPASAGRGRGYINIAGKTDIIPKIKSFTPKEGNYGDTITLSGENLDTVIKVTFGGVESSEKLTKDNNGQLQAVVPNEGKTGKIAVTNRNGTSESDNTFEVLSTDPEELSGDEEDKKSDVYHLLAPIGNLICVGDEEGCIKDNIGEYFNVIFKIAIGLCGALAVIMIVIGGVQYMGDESVFGKTEAKSKITSAILGLIIALASYALLNTIDPALLGKDGVNIKQVSAEIIDLPDAGDDSVDPDFNKGKGTYHTDASISPGVTSAVEKLKNGWTIIGFRVFTNNRMSIILTKDGKYDRSNVISISPGREGYAEVGQGKMKDWKTPKGEWKILEVRTSGESGVPVFNRSGSNMGAAFWWLNPTTKGERGIGMHGNKQGTLGVTRGCIRLKNADIVALLPYVKPGISVVVGDN